MDKVEIVEVGPRDGLQNIGSLVPTAAKIDFIRRLAAAGIKRMEIGSFVSPKAIPQMSDMDEVVAGLGPLPGLRAMALVPNSKGARRAVAAGLTELIFVISMSEAHNMSNVRRPVEASIEDFRLTLAEIDPDKRLHIRVGLATTFHCPFDGVMDEEQVLRTIHKIARLRDGLEFALSDTTGMALPGHVGRVARRCIAEFGDTASWAFHGHDTAGFGIANVLAAFEAGVACFDSSAAGIGGCPFAPGATGNIATEDLAYLFARMGVATGIDLAKLMDAADLAASFSDTPTGSHALAMPRARLLSPNGVAAAC
ncbi:MAG: hydroxymethylglutaryl-CoA lyase [Rhizobiales bacterium]|nr:hydroxymethylglutaryl-CoA lyase [Hyphomicrobiales bacterium]